MATEQTTLESTRLPAGAGPVLLFKACPRCRGTMERVRDSDGAYLHCFQCGYLKELEPVRAAGKRRNW